VGWGTEVRSVEGQVELLVYPKVFAVERVGAAARVPLGPDRAADELLGDPARVVGVRPYRAGDPLRQVDWRATARAREPVVRILEPTATLRAVVFLDTRVPQLARGRVAPPELEFTIAVAASVAADLHRRGVGLGLRSNGTAGGVPLAVGPSSAPGALVDCLEALARTSPFGGRPFADVLLGESRTFARGTTCLVVAADLPDATLLALDELRRRHVPVTLVAVATPGLSPPLPRRGLVASCFLAEYHDDWDRRDQLELALAP
jgi:uncharacterized protein (DUF58 family)